MNQIGIETRVREYYEDKLARFGTTHRGVDWNSDESQHLRLNVLLRGLAIDQSPSCKLLDFGCGYGALLDVVESMSIDIHYTGFDVSPAMIEAARIRHDKQHAFAEFTNNLPESKFDFVVASGVFNVKNEFENEHWEEYLVKCLDQMSEVADRGFAFNLLTIYSDADRRQNHLYYADPLKYFQFCRDRYSTKVSLIHDYELYEFTIVVKR